MSQSPPWMMTILAVTALLNGDGGKVMLPG
jgi:hypothetical protein